VRRLGWILLGSGAALSAAAPAAGFLLDRLWGRDLVMISPHDDATVELNRSLWSPGEPVAEIYGVPTEPTRVLFADPSRLVVPHENPALTLLKVDKSAGENPLQARTVWFFVRGSLLAFPMLAALGGLLLVLTRR
jgi:hypothetical protein